MSVLQEGIRALLLSAAGRRVARAISGDIVTIVMLHRFSERPAGSLYGRHTAGELRALLRSLRDSGIPLVPLGDLCAARRLPRGGVVFTVDDGFADFATIAWPVFREFACPVTIFLTTGFVDGALWPWWEQVLWAFMRSPRTGVSLRVAGRSFVRHWAGAAGAHVVAAELTEVLKLVPDGERETLLAALPAALSVEIPTLVPADDAAMTWDDVRRLGAEGATFGPHTVSHPILSRVDDARAELEIVSSWRRLREETDAVVPVFCYPNGDAGSFGRRERDIVAAEGFALAVSTVPGYVRPRDIAAGSASRYALPRQACPHDPRALDWIATGWPGLRG